MEEVSYRKYIGGRNKQLINQSRSHQAKPL